MQIWNTVKLTWAYVPWQSEYPDYTPLLAKILEGLLSRSDAGDKISHHEEVKF